jgi:hypothetical protein
MKTASRNLLLATLLMAATAWADEPILRVLDLKTPSGATGQIQHRTAKDKQWYQAYVGTTGVLRDHFKTSPETVQPWSFSSAAGWESTRIRRLKSSANVRWPEWVLRCSASS